MINVLLLFDWLAHVPPVLEFVVLIASVVLALYTLKRYVYKPVRSVFEKWNRGMDTLVGYPAVLDPGTGREIQPATRPLADRVYDLEATNIQVADALTVIAANQKDILRLQHEFDERKEAGMQIVEEWTKWRDTHEAEARMREDRLAEWEAWRQEQNLLMEAVVNSHEAPHQ